MQKIVFLCIAVVGLAGSVQAQDECSKVELFGGYSYLHVDAGLTREAGFLFTNGGIANGWNASVGANVNQWFSLVADFSGHYGEILNPVFPINTNTKPHIGGVGFNRHSFLFGPRLSYRTRKGFMPFAHFLLGGAHDDAFFNSISETRLTWALGGGMDMKVSKRLALRLIQADYVPTKAREIQDNVRISTGIVWHFGK